MAHAAKDVLVQKSPISLPEALRVLVAQRKQNGTSVPPKTGHVKLNFLTTRTLLTLITPQHL